MAEQKQQQDSGLNNDTVISLNAFGTKIVKQERFNPNVFKDILLHEGISDVDKKRLKQYFRLRTNGNCVEVKYDFKKDMKADGYARVYADKGLSLQMFERDIRGALAQDYYFDVDMKNAHPTILLKMCKDKNWGHEKLEYYVNNRDAVLNDIAKYYNSSVGGAKQIMNTMMYLGGIPLAPNNDANYDFLKLYKEEMSKIAENVKNANLNIYKLVGKKKDTEHEKLSSCMHYVITTEEHKILMCINNFLESKGRNVDVLIYDGCLVRKLNGETTMDDKLLKGCEGFIENTLGYPIKLAVKPLTTTLVFNKKVESTTFDYLDGELRTYEAVKPFFEKTHFKLRNPTVYCEIDSNGDVIIRKVEVFRTLYSNLWVESKTPGFSRWSFVDYWTADPAIKTYERMDLIPPPRTCPSNIFNMWKGYAIDKIDCESSGNFQPFVDLASVLVSHEQAHLDYVLKWCAQLVQFPAVIIGIILTVIGEEGIGKNYFFHKFSQLLGSDYYFETADPENQLFAKHANARLNRFLICIDEGKKKDMFNNRDKLWNMITADTWNYEKKGIDTTTLPNYCRYVITTNHDVVIPPGRRSFIVSASSEKFGKMDYFNEMDTYFSDHRNQKAIMEYLRSIDLSGMNWIMDKPKNETMDGLVSVCGCEILRFLEYEYLRRRKHCTSGYFKDSGKELALNFIQFLEDKLKYKELKVHEWSYRLFNKLKRYIDASGGAIVKTTPKNVRTFTFHLDKLADFLKVKGLLNNLDCYMLLDLDEEVDKVPIEDDLDRVVSKKTVINQYFKSS